MQAPRRMGPRGPLVQRAIASLSLGLLYLLSLLYWVAPAQGQAVSPAVSPEVLEALKESPSVRVIITLRPPATPINNPKARDAEIAAIQDRVLAQLDAAEFTLTHRFSIANGLAGEVSMSGLKKLLADPEVVQIDLAHVGPPAN